MDVVLSFRGSNTATVKDIVDLRKWLLSNTVNQLQRNSDHLRKSLVAELREELQPYQAVPDRRRTLGDGCDQDDLADRISRLPTELRDSLIRQVQEAEAAGNPGLDAPSGNAALIS